MSILLRLTRPLVTLVMVAVAGFLLVQLWNVYMIAPWTRDGRVFAQTVVVAPEVSGTVISVSIANDHLVQKGDILFALDKSRFQIALDQAQASFDAAQLRLRQRREDVARRRGLTGLISAEEQANTDIAASIASAGLGGARATRDLARLDLQRATVAAPVTGYVTHLRLQPGDYADAGKPVVAIIDSSSFQVVGYFEETKIARVHVGDRARVLLMGYPQALEAHVASIGRGISDPNDAVNTRGLPSVNPVFEWVRLAQRIPVDVQIDRVPAGVMLAAGMTASIDVGSAAEPPDGVGGRVRRWFEDNL